MQIRTDLAMECRASNQTLPGVTSRSVRHGRIEEVRVTIESEDAAGTLNKARGQYMTLYLADLYHADAEERAALSRHIARILRSMLPAQGDMLAVGLGNRHMTADALGSRVLDSLLITRHVRSVQQDPALKRLRGVCAVAPGVLGMTGMETAEVVQGIVEHVHPAAVIAIDALAARESCRICTTIQITDTGIRPGSGVGNHRMGLTLETLGVPVIAIGVPMVVYASVIARDALGLLLQDMGMEEEEHEQAVDELVRKVTRQGLGELVVTPREVDEMVGKVAAIIADGINQALQTGLTEKEIRTLSHDGP